MIPLTRGKGGHVAFDAQANIPGTTRLDAKDTFCAALSAIRGVELARSRFGANSNPAWRVAGKEFAHLHSATLIDLRIPPPLQVKLRADPNAHFRAGKSEWVELEFHSQSDVAKITALALEVAEAIQAKRK